MLLRSIAAAVVVAFKGVGSAKNALSKGPSRQMSQEAAKQGAEAAKEGVEAAKGAWVKVGVAVRKWGRTAQLPRQDAVVPAHCTVVICMLPMPHAGPV